VEGYRRVSKQLPSHIWDGSEHVESQMQVTLDFEKQVRITARGSSGTLEESIAYTQAEVAQLIDILHRILSHAKA
jgi:hypothetical protein